MIRTLRQLITMRAAIQTNVLLYYLRRFWIVGKKIPESVYEKRELKQILAILIIVSGQGAALAGKILYLAVFAGLPAILLSSPAAENTAFDHMVNILFFMTGICGSGQESMIFKVTREKLTCLKFMRMDSVSYVRAYLSWIYIPFFIWYLPCILVTARILGGTLMEGFLLWAVLLMMRAAGEALHLKIYDKTGKVIARSMVFCWSLILVCMGGAYGTSAAGIVLVTPKRLFHPVVLLVLAAAGGYSLYYILKGYPHYKKKLHRTADAKWITSELIKDAGKQSAVKEVGVKEKDLHTEADGKKSRDNLRGYAYFNALFFRRHRRQILRPVYYRLAAIAILLACGGGFRIVSPQAAYAFAGRIMQSMPVLVFVMYAVTVAEKACKAMFYNCDKSMLKFGFYRKPDVILKNFKLRLKQIALYNLIVGAGICAAVMIFCRISGYPVPGAEMFLYCIAVLMLSVFFTVHHLFMYYVFQPYSEEMNIKNPFFKAVNFIIYMICLLCFWAETGSIAFTAGVILVTAVYTAAALQLTYRYAPKTFRVK